MDIITFPPAWIYGLRHGMALPESPAEVWPRIHGDRAWGAPETGGHATEATQWLCL